MCSHPLYNPFARRPAIATHRGHKIWCQGLSYYTEDIGRSPESSVWWRHHISLGRAKQYLQGAV